MTLNTKIYVHGEIDALDVFNFLIHQLLEFDGDNRGFADVHTQAEADHRGHIDRAPRTWTMETVIGQGLPAWTMVHYRPGGAYRTEAEAQAHELDICNVPDAEHYDATRPVCDGSDHEPACHVEVGMDTAYGFKGPNGMRCDRLHSVLIARLGAMLDERGVLWSWRNEYTGELNQGTAGLEGLLRAGDGANAWCDHVALPGIQAEIAGRQLT